MPTDASRPGLRSTRYGTVGRSQHLAVLLDAARQDLGALV